MIGQPDNLVDPPEGRRDTMEGPADASDPAQAVTDAVASAPPVADVAPIVVVPPVPPRPCRITFHGFTASEPPRVEVRAWLARLGALTAPMTGGEVAIEALDQGRQERRYRVRMELVLPAGSVLVGSDLETRQPDPTIAVPDVSQ